MARASTVHEWSARGAARLFLLSLLCAACSGAGPEYPVVHELTQDEMIRAIDTWVSPVDSATTGALRDSLAACGCRVCEQEFLDAFTSPALPGLLVGRLSGSCTHMIDGSGRCQVPAVAVAVDTSLRCLDLASQPCTLVCVPATRDDSGYAVALLQAALARVLLDEQEGVVEATIVCSKPGLEEAVKKICEDDRFSTAYTCPYVFQTTQGLNWRVRYPAGSDFAATSPGVPDSTVLPVRWIQSGPAQDELEFDLLYASVHSERGGRWVDYRWSRFRLTFASGRNTGMTRTDIRTWRLPKKMFAEFGISEEQAREMRRARLRPVQAIADSILTSLDVDRSHLFPALRDECSTYVVETGFYVSTQGTSRQVLEGPTITIRKSDLKVLEVAWSSDRTPPH